MIIINNNDNDDNYHNDHFSRSRAPGQRINVRDGAVLANKKRVIQFFMIFYSFRFIPDLMMFVMFVMILFLNSFLSILDYGIQVCNYFLSLIALSKVPMSGVDFNILFLFCYNETYIFQFFVFYMFPDVPVVPRFNVLKVIKMLVIVVLLFGISWLPYQVLLMALSYS